MGETIVAAERKLGRSEEMNRLLRLLNRVWQVDRVPDFVVVALLSRHRLFALKQSKRYGSPNADSTPVPFLLRIPFLLRGDLVCRETKGVQVGVLQMETQSDRLALELRQIGLPVPGDVSCG